MHTIPDALELIGSEPVGIMLDLWHISDPEAIAAQRRTEIVGVHVVGPARADPEPLRPRAPRRRRHRPRRRRSARSRRAGYDGWYDVEIFSDNGVFGDAFPDSLWDVDAAELARRARESFERVAAQA